MSNKARTEKLHVLAVLEDRTLRNAYGIRSKLTKDFDLQPHLNTLRKNLQRCFNQGLVKREKLGSNYHYRISEKGKERLRRIRAKRQRKLEAFQLKRHLSVPGNLGPKNLLGRAIEVISVINLCDVVLARSQDRGTLNLARSTRMYWQLEFLQLAPYITDHIIKTIERMSEQWAKTMARLLGPIGV